MAKRILSWVLTCALLLACISGITLIASAETTVKAISGVPGWNNMENQCDGTFQGYKVIQWKGRGGGLSFNNSTVANEMGVPGGQPYDLTIKVDYYWDKQEGGDGAWWHFRTTNADGSYTADDGFGSFTTYGMTPGAWNELTVTRENQTLGMSGKDDLYINVDGGQLGSANALYIRGLAFIATDGEGNVYKGLWGSYQRVSVDFSDPENVKLVNATNLNVKGGNGSITAIPVGETGKNGVKLDHHNDGFYFHSENIGLNGEDVAVTIEYYAENCGNNSRLVFCEEGATNPEGDPIRNHILRFQGLTWRNVDGGYVVNTDHYLAGEKWAVETFILSGEEATAAFGKDISVFMWNGQDNNAFYVKSLNIYPASLLAEKTDPGYAYYDFLNTVPENLWYPDYTGPDFYNLNWNTNGTEGNGSVTENGLEMVSGPTYITVGDAYKNVPAIAVKAYFKENVEGLGGNYQSTEDNWTNAPWQIDGKVATLIVDNAAFTNGANGGSIRMYIGSNILQRVEVYKIIDKTELNNALSTAENADTIGKTDASIQALNDVVAAAQALADNDFATQAEVDACIKALQAAVEGLQDIKQVTFGDRINCTEYTALARPTGDNYQRLENGDVDIGYNNQGDYIDFQVNVTTAGIYKIVAALGTGNAPATVQLQDGKGKTYGSVVVPTTGWGPDAHQDYTFKGVVLEAGVQILRIYYAQSSANFWYMDLMDGSGDIKEVGPGSRINCTEFTELARPTGDNYQRLENGDVDIGFNSQGDFIRFQVNVTKAGLYNIKAALGTGNAPATVELRDGEGNVYGSVVVPTTGWGADAHQDYVFESVELKEGVQILEIYYAQSSANFWYMDLLDARYTLTNASWNEEASNGEVVEFDGSYVFKYNPGGGKWTGIGDPDGILSSSTSVTYEYEIYFDTDNGNDRCFLAFGDVSGWHDVVEGKPEFDGDGHWTTGTGYAAGGHWGPTPAKYTWGKITLTNNQFDPTKVVADCITRLGGWMDNGTLYLRSIKVYDNDDTSKFIELKFNEIPSEPLPPEPAAIDVVVTDIFFVLADGTYTDAPAVGEKVRLAFAVKNNGTETLPEGTKYGGIVKMGDAMLGWSDNYKGTDTAPALAPGETITLITCGGGANSDGTWDVPTPAGEFELFAQVNDNPGDGIADEDTSNNTFTKAFKSHGADEYDVVVTDLKLVNGAREEVNPLAGEVVWFKITVKNNGSVAIPAGSKYGFIVKLGDKDGEFLVWGDEMKAGNSPELKPGETMDLYSCGGGASSDGSWKAATGNFTLTAQVNDNPGDGIKEYDTENNFFTASFFTHADDEYDVVVSDLKLVNGEGDPIAVIPGNAVRFQITVKNNGDTAIPAGAKYGAVVRLGGNDGSVLAWGDEYKAGNSPELKPGETLTFITNGGNGGGWWEIPEGQFTLTAQVNDNPGDGIKEYDSENNFFSVDFTAHAADEYDVTITNLEIVNAAREVIAPTVGSKVFFKITVLNSGDTIIPAGAEYGFTVKYNDQLLGWGDELKQGNSPELAPGATLELYTCGGPDNGDGSWIIPEGEFELVAEINDTKNIKEYNYENDSITATFTGVAPDDSALRTAIEEGEALDLSEYTEESAKAFTDALAAAKEVDGAAPTQEQIDAALKALNDAKAALVKKDVQPAAKMGDLDGDGKITSTDARMALQISVNKITVENSEIADVDGDGKVTSTDARMLLQVSANKLTEDQLPCNQQPGPSES